MSRHCHTFWLDDTDPAQRELQRWLQHLAGERKKASTMVEALLAHHAGAAGVTLTTLNDKLDRLLALLHSTSPSTKPPPTGPSPPSPLPDGLDRLDTLGL